MAIRRLGVAALGVPTALSLLMVMQSGALAQSSVTRGSAADLRVLTPLKGEIIGAGSFKLDFSFKSLSASPITRVELHVDGVQWAGRNLDVPSLGNVLTFEVDGSTLAEGPHTFQVKVINKSGAISTTDLQVVAQSKNSTLGGENATPASVSAAGAPQMTFRALPSRRLMGTVEIQMDVKAPNNQNPYVSFYVDKQFKVLKNYPPYSFLFDTTTVSNGKHIIEATGYLESSNAATTTRKEVFVDNPGGNTERATDIKDLSNKSGEPAQPQLSAVPSALAASVRATSGVKPIQLMLPNISGTRSVEPRVARTSVKSTAVATKTLAATETRVAQPVAKGLHAPMPVATGISVGRPMPSTPGAATRAAGFATAQAVRSADLMVPHRSVKSAPRTARGIKPVLSSAMTNEFGKKLMVAFDGSAINFDVEPRVEAGIPLAPFRQIFEHTGGQVMWAADAKTVRALNADREVIIKVGSPSATVNGQSVSMERTSYIDRGRTIVPLSFVGKALDVDVDFDPATGKLTITSKK
nr:copper amine oxidase N-terminal domain-containing protein [Armatimonas sp.]